MLPSAAPAAPSPGPALSACEPGGTGVVATVGGSQPTAVVIGAGIAGLLAAQVACRHFGSVVLLEKDGLQGRVDAQTVEEVGRGRWQAHAAVCGPDS